MSGRGTISTGKRNTGNNPDQKNVIGRATLSMVLTVPTINTNGVRGIGTANFPNISAAQQPAFCVYQISVFNDGVIDNFSILKNTGLTTEPFTTDALGCKAYASAASNGSLNVTVEYYHIASGGDQPGATENFAVIVYTTNITEDSVL